MNVDTKAKVLVRFGSLQTMCVDRRSKKLLKFPLCTCRTRDYVHTHTLITFQHFVYYETLDYESRH